MSEQVDDDTSVTLLEFALADPSFPFVAASRDGATATLQEMLPRGDSGYGEFFSVTGRDPDDLLEMADEHGDIEADLLVDRGDGGLFEFVVAENCPAVTLAEAGALPRTVEATDGDGRITAEVPADADTTEIIERFLASHPDASLERKRQQPYGTPMFSPRELESALEDELTDRQREVLLAAHRAGYYDWPRGKTAEELADEFDLSAPTLHDHLRAAERKLVSLVFTSAPDDGVDRPQA